MPRKPTEIDTDLLRKLNDAIKYSGIKPKTIAEQVGIDRSAFSEYKYFKNMPSLTTFKKICKVIDADANEILDLK